MTSKTDPPREPSDELELDFSIADLSDAADMAEMEPPRPKPTAKASDNAVNRFIQTDRHGRDRRRWKRFTIEGAIVMIPQTAFWRMGKTSYIKLGPVKNISMKGLAIHYVEKNQKLLGKAATLSIMFPGEGIIVDKIPFRIVGNVKVADLPDDKEVRNLCVAFERLLPMQKMQMEMFIDTYGNELGD
ncbi:hypothetical protein [Desulfosudis oleivorans]|uniref:PilZ domain-containing protein n=1 Tax=Desulfosudis oleivorans (strain DSM 6200 / JCM 39069 / Hxd3) TaxID=96561 RepID=A8ZSQ1_DESOH|nr:hypothetical protein [Desulfosudis oleivorans]ABW65964.1 hypothetical protein Dole_0154 [Desulfosudis oleivorans Hxd3]